MTEAQAAEIVIALQDIALAAGTVFAMVSAAVFLYWMNQR